MKTYKMHTQFMVTLTHGLGDDPHDVDADVEYTVYPARPATLEEPAESASVSIAAVKVDGKFAPVWLFRMVEEDEELASELLAHAADMDEHAKDQHADALREERMLERNA